MAAALRSLLMDSRCSNLSGNLGNGCSTSVRQPLLSQQAVVFGSLTVPPMCSREKCVALQYSAVQWTERVPIYGVTLALLATFVGAVVIFDASFLPCDYALLDFFLHSTFYSYTVLFVCIFLFIWFACLSRAIVCCCIVLWLSLIHI